MSGNRERPDGHRSTSLSWLVIVGPLWVLVVLLAVRALW